MSWVKMLDSEDELHDAIAHAIGFERDIVARTSARVSHYEELNGLGELLPLGLDTPLAAPATDLHSEAV